MAQQQLLMRLVKRILQRFSLTFYLTRLVLVDSSHDSVLVSYKDRLIEIFSSALKVSNEHPQIQLMGVLGLGLLSALKGYMSRSEVSTLLFNSMTSIQTNYFLARYQHSIVKYCS